MYRVRLKTANRILIAWNKGNPEVTLGRFKTAEMADRLKELAESLHGDEPVWVEKEEANNDQR